MLDILAEYRAQKTINCRFDNGQNALDQVVCRRPNIWQTSSQIYYSNIPTVLLFKVHSIYSKEKTFKD